MAEVEDEPKRPAPLLSAPVPLTSEHDLSGFDCGEPALNDWLRHRALKNESRFSRTYVICEGNLVVAYFCILAGAVERAAAPGKVATQCARHDPGLGDRAVGGQSRSFG